MLQFFADMEKNIKKKLLRSKDESAEVVDLTIDTSPSPDEEYYTLDTDGAELQQTTDTIIADSKTTFNSPHPIVHTNKSTSGELFSYNLTINTSNNNNNSNSNNSNNQLLGRRYRTISTMDDEILLTMRQSNGADRRKSDYKSIRSGSIVSVDEKDSKSPAPTRIRAGTKGNSSETPLPIRVDMKDMLMSVGSFLSAPFKQTVNIPLYLFLRNYTSFLYSKISLRAVSNENLSAVNIFLHFFIQLSFSLCSFSMKFDIGFCDDCD